jgi:hypothetical protein
MIPPPILCSRSILGWDTIIQRGTKGVMAFFRVAVSVWWRFKNVLGHQLDLLVQSNTKKVMLLQCALDPGNGGQLGGIPATSVAVTRCSPHHPKLTLSQPAG